MSKNRFALPALVCIFGAFLILRPSLALSSARDGVYLCLYTLIPTLFPFFVISRVLISSVAPGKTLGKAFSRFFRVSPSLLTAYIIGLISGFPAGGAAVTQIYKNGLCSKDEAERALGFCNNTGPAFALGAVGAMLGSVKYAAVIYLLQIPSSLIAARLMPRAKVTRTELKPQNPKCGLADAVKDSIWPMMAVCAFVIFFSPVLTLIRLTLDFAGAGTAISAAVLSLTEISGGIKYSCAFLPVKSAFILCAFACGWSGLSVILQLRALTSESGLGMKYCVTGKLIQGNVCIFLAIVYLGIEKFIPV